MNASEDWDVIWRWQWLRRPLWQPYYRDPSHPEGRAAKTVPVWDTLLKQNNAKRVLDANCGLGIRALILHEAGYEMVGVDSSSVAIAGGKELAAVRELPVDFRQVKWLDLAETFSAEFDAIINDGFSMILSRSELRFAAHNFASVLKPGGIFVFTGADQWSNPDDRPALVDHAWQAAPRYQLRSDYEHDGTHLTLVVARDKSEIGVVENYLFVVRDGSGPQLQTASICNSVQWTWDDYQHVCKEAGFTSLESIKVPLGRREQVLNVARR
jgi:SAM-dependent methyltransferase